MRRLLIATAALATLVAPMAASAQNNGEIRHDRRDVAQEKKDVRQATAKARRDGVVTPAEHRNIQGERRDVAGARRELRSDVRTQRFDRSNRNWWRGRGEFSGFNGRRAGFWFAPGYGYRQIDPRFANARWARGGIVPLGYRNFYVQDPVFYGLRPAPFGMKWIWVGNNLALISTRTGLIVDIVPNVYDY